MLDSYDAVIRRYINQTEQQAEAVPEGYCDAYELLGWAHAEFCTMLDRGKDPRKEEIPSLVSRMEKAMLNVAPKLD